MLSKYPAYTKTNYLEVFVHHSAADSNNVVRPIVSLHHSCDDCVLATLEEFYLTNVTR